MIHPFNNELILDEMQNAAEPQTDRELLLEVRNRVEMVTLTFDDKIGRLTDAISRAVTAIETLEEKRIMKLEKRMDISDQRWAEMKGGWKVIAAVGAISATIGGLVVKFLFK